MNYQSYIVQIIMYLAASTYLLLMKHDNLAISDYHWTNVFIFVIIALNAILSIAYFATLSFDKKDKSTVRNKTLVITYDCII